VGHVGLGDWVRHWGGGELEEYRVYIIWYIHIHIYVGTGLTVRRRIANSYFPFHVQPS
jgi:hypothetical protein